MTKTVISATGNTVQISVNGIPTEKVVDRGLVEYVIPPVDQKRPQLMPAFNSGLLPMAVRWVSAYGPAVALERPPERRLITYEDQRFELWFPWMIHFFVFSPGDLRLVQANLYARKDPVTDHASLLYQLPIPNQYRDGTFCLPADALAQTHTSLSDAIDFAYHTIWSSPFNPEVQAMIDYNHGVFTGRARCLGNKAVLKMYGLWEAKSLEQVLALRLPDHTYFKTVANDINGFYCEFMTSAALYQHIASTMRSIKG